MLGKNEPDQAPADARGQTDLKREYRPIGIGAVAAALAMSRKADADQTQDAANSNARIGTGGSRAA